MDPKSCSKSSIIVCESSSESVLEAVIVTDVKGETTDSVSKHVLIEKQGEEQNETKPQLEKENDSRMCEDGVGCSNVSAHAVHEEVNVTAVAASVALTKAKAKEFHMVDLSSGGGESEDGERICRICHFGSGQTPDRVSGKTVSLDLIEIGCNCKNELGLAHLHCAEAWFKLRGNSVCEICGCTAKNVTVSLAEEELSEELHTRLDERRRRRRRGNGQSFCILMVFLLTIFLLHWFFKKMSGYYQNT